MLNKIVVAVLIFFYPSFSLAQSQGAELKLAPKNDACPAIYSAAREERECWAYQAYIARCPEHDLFPIAKAYTGKFCESLDDLEPLEGTTKNTIELAKSTKEALKTIVDLSLNEMLDEIDKRISRKLVDELASVAFDMKVMMDRLNVVSTAMTDKMSRMDQAFEDIKMAQSDQVAEVTAQIENSMASNLAGVIDQLDERVSMLNGELAMATTDNIDSALKEQAMLFSEVTTEFMAVIRAGLNQDDPEADLKMQALMDTQSKLEERIGELNMRLLKASQRPKP